MKKPTFLSNGIFVLALLLCLSGIAQNLVPFSPRYDQAIKGDILLIGNSNVGLHASNPYNGAGTNDNIDAAVYVDIDGDATTFNSSSADLDVPYYVNCYQVVYAGLYWSAVVNGTDPISDIKFKTPGGTYMDITGTQIYFQNAATNNNSNTYVYYHDVTSIITALPDPEGTYTVANISSLIGPKPNSEGLSAGWSLFIVYEDPLLPSKYITSFDGITKITSTINETFPVSGFTTIPVGPVRAKFAFSTIEGDQSYTGDYLRLNGNTISATNNAGTIIRPGNNFFNSSVSIIDPVTNTPELFTARNPNGSNTLGFDAGIINIPNAGNTIIANGATSATISLGSNLDIYYYYFSAFAIEIIAPNIVLTKIVEDELGNDIGGQVVDLGDQLYYTIGFQNTGNDTATNLTIRDILPINVVFNYPADIGVLPPGVTVQSYNPATREIIFSIDRSIVEEHDPVSEIRFKVTVVSTCSLLNDACSNNIDNQAYATYQGTIDPTFTISDDPSYNSNSGCLLTPGATNFLADLNDCTFEEQVILCGASIDLTAGSGYSSYSWSTSPSGTPVIGTSQSITVTSPGTYYVHNTADAPCQSTDQVFNVITFGANVTNPIIPYADEVVTCPNDGKLLPNFYLCGANDARFIQTGITDTTSMIWEKLDETSCTAVINQDCANEDTSCTWNQVATGPDFLIDTAGQYRLTLNYTGGCFNEFYFNVYTNLLAPTVTSRDIYCTTPGEITVGSVPSGYEYSLDGVNYQPSNVFSVTTAGLYSIYIRQVGVSPNPCIFSVPDVQIRERDFTVSTIVTQPLCYGEQGSIFVAANDVRPQYFYSIYLGATLINSVGPIMESDYSFENLNPGTYTVNVSTEDGCIYSGDIEIITPLELSVSASLTNPLTCTDGEVTIYPMGGTPPYSYFINSATVFQNTPLFNVTTSGVYDITVVDFNNCSAQTSITVNATPAPVFNITKTDILCAEEGNVGVISINVTNPNGNSLEYSIDNGVTFFNSPIFTGLAVGNYDVVVQYTIGTDVCVTTPQTISITSVAAINGTVTLTTPYTCTTNGTITVSGASGGTAPYEYSLDGVTFQSGTTFTGLTNGTYNITIRDANGCMFAANSITIDPLNPPTDLTFSNSPLTCPTITSDITITGTTGGTGALEYQIIAPAAYATAYQSSNIFSGLGPNTYTFQVRDANNCVYSKSYTIAPLPLLSVSTILTKDLDCSASPDAIITGIITGGTAPFTYAVSFNGSAYSSLGATGTPFNYGAASAGTYQFEITDANGCTAVTGVQTVSAISLPEISSITSTPNLCNGDTNGTIQVIINNLVGTPPFVINVNNDTTGTNYGTQTTGLPSGNYTVTLTDSKSCEDIESITIGEPSPITLNYHVVDITCDPVGGVSKGSIIIDNVTGGTAPYDYFVTGTNGYFNLEINAAGTTSTTFDVVDFGLYQINIIDANGCSVLIQDVLVASPPNDLDITITPLADCITGGEAIVQIGSSLASAGPFFFDIYRGSIPAPPPGGTWLPEDAPGSKTVTFTGLIPGVTYTFIVYDSTTGCSYYETSTLPIPTNSTLTTNALTSNNITCKGSVDGNVSFTVNSIYGVSADIDYEIYDSLSLVPTGISGTGTVPANGLLSITNLGLLPFGTYFVLVKEISGPNAGCSIVTVPFNITESSKDLNITASVNKIANCNPNSGVISAIATDGTAPYLYQITTSAIAPLATDLSWASANTFNVDANSYYVHVKDAYGCIKSTPVIVLPSDPQPVISATLNNQCTVTEGNFEIDVILTTTGIAPYSYSIDGGAFQKRTAPFTISNLTSGNHTVEVRDFNGCGNLINVNIVPPLDLIPAITAFPTCNDDDGELTITGSGGSGSYSYTISPNPASIILSGNVFSGVPSGTYTVTILDTSTSCSENVSIVLPVSTPAMVSTTPTSTITCFGDSNGAFDLIVSGYSGAYNYEVFDSLGTSVSGVVSANTSTNPVSVTGLIAGNYTVVVTETASPFCTSTSGIVTIASPASTLALTATETSNVTCDNNSGTITAVANGGWGNYEYELTGSATIAYSPNRTFTNLSAGSYTVNVRDSGGCIVSASVTLVVPPPINATVTPSTTALTCFGDTSATITISNVTGGQGSYSYTIHMLAPTVSSSGPQASPVFSGLGAGTYTVDVTDGYNCVFTSANIVITEPTQIQATLVKATSQTCLRDATLTLSATGGTGSYEYSAADTFATILGSFASSTTFSVPVGTYTYYVRDANGCISNASNEIKIDTLPPLVINLDISNATVNCTGDSTGVIVAVAQGGLGSYVYTLQDVLGNDIPATQTSPGVFTDLPAGNYRVKVDSGDCLTTSSTISITEPILPLVAVYKVTDVSCNGSNDGILEINASGGTGIIKYAISPQMNQFFESPIFENLTSGTYQAIAQDELGCYVLLDFTINEPSPIVLNIVPNSIIPEICDGDTNGEFSIDISGGTAPYSVSLDDIDGVYTVGSLTQTQFDFTGLIGGDHIVYVRDAQGCETEWNITFPESVKIDPVAVVEYVCENNVQSNIVTVTVDPSITDPSELDYSLDGGAFQTSNVFINVTPGIDHFIDVRHTNGCIKRTNNFDIIPYQPLALVINDGDINQIVATVTGGSGIYEFTLNGESYGSANTFTIYSSGDYTVTVTDSFGCVASATGYFEFIDICISNYFTPNGDGVLDGWGPGCTFQYTNLTFSIYDRYGRKVATLNAGEKWDGKYKGEELPTGDYWFVVKLNDPKDNRDFVGHFTLYR